MKGTLVSSSVLNSRQTKISPLHSAVDDCSPFIMLDVELCEWIPRNGRNGQCCTILSATAAACSQKNHPCNSSCLSHRCPRHIPVYRYTILLHLHAPCWILFLLHNLTIVNVKRFLTTQNLFEQYRLFGDWIQRGWDNKTVKFSVRSSHDKIMLQIGAHFYRNDLQK